MKNATVEKTKQGMDKAGDILGLVYRLIVAFVFMAFAISFIILCSPVNVAIRSIIIIVILSAVFFFSPFIFRRKSGDNKSTDYDISESKRAESKGRKIWLYVGFPCLIYAVCFLLRWVYCLRVNSYVSQVSDFNVVLEEAVSGVFVDRLEYYRFSIHKFFYPFILHLLGANSQDRIYLVQCICVSFVPVLLYFLCRRMMGTRAGLLAAAIYIVWPAQLIYSSVITEEHFSAVFTLCILGIIMVAANETSRLKWGQALLLSLAAGVISGLNSFFKDWGSVIMVAVLIMSVWFLIHYHSKEKCILLILSVFLIFAGRKGTIYALDLLPENILGIEAYNGGIIAMEMYGTLYPGAPGDYNGPANEEYRNIAEQNGYDFQKTNKQAMEILKGRISGRVNEMPELILKKGRMAYKDDSAVFFWVFEREMQRDVYLQIEKKVSLLKQADEIIWFTIVLLAVISVIAVIMTKKKSVFFLSLCTLGFGMVSLLIESQGRYKYSIQPVWIILAVYGITILFEIWNKAGIRYRKKYSN